jgi:prephenate dehydrogenase
LESLAAGAATIVLAVPVAATRDAAAALLPHLTPAHLVLEVGSVKHGPVVVLTELLGRRTPWVATHPLFGPSSIALGERPLRAVVCPNPLHPTAAARAAALYERIGCEVVEQAADDHDRLMARTHAIAFFVAKGLLEVGAGAEQLTPPSFSALARATDLVRTDAGHLFLAIERENPYAADARQTLLDALSRVHRQLESEEPIGVPDSPGLVIPDLGAQAPELKETRELIDELDREIVLLLARRAQLAHRAARIKAERGHGVRDRERERALLEARRSWAEELGLPDDAVADVFEAVLRFSRGLQSA